MTTEQQFEELITKLSSILSSLEKMDTRMILVEAKLAGLKNGLRYPYYQVYPNFPTYQPTTITWYTGTETDTTGHTEITKEDHINKLKTIPKENN